MCGVAMEQIGFVSSVPKIVCKMTNSPSISQEQNIVNGLFIIYGKLTVCSLWCEQDFLLIVSHWGQVLTSPIWRRAVYPIHYCRGAFFTGNGEWSFNIGASIFCILTTPISLSDKVRKTLDLEEFGRRIWWR